MRTTRGEALFAVIALGLLVPTIVEAQQAKGKTEKYRVLKSSDGLSCQFSQDLSMTLSTPFSGTVTGTANHFTCINKAKKEVEIALKSVGLENGKVAIRTKEFGTIYRGNEPGEFGAYEMTDRQIRQLKTFLGLALGQTNAAQNVGSHAEVQKPKANESKALAKHETPLKVNVTSVAVATKFQVYVGGGTNLSVPATFQSPLGAGGGMPAISMSEGSTFLAGEVRSKDAKTKLIKIELTIDNPTDKTQSFKIGDLSLLVSGERFSDFMAVGYEDRLCAMSDADRRTVKQIVVEVAPKSQRIVSYVFPLVDPDAKQGEVVLQHSLPVTFRIGAANIARHSQGPQIKPSPTKQLGASQESRTNQPISVATAPAARLEAAIKRIDAASALYEPKGYKFACIVATRKANENAIIGILKSGGYFKATPTSWQRLSVEEASKLPEDIKEDLNSLPKNPLVWLVNVDSLRDPAYGTQYQSLLNDARQALFGTLPGSVIFTLYPPDTPPDELKTNGNFDPAKLAYASLNYSVLSSAHSPRITQSPATVASARTGGGGVAPRGGSSYQTTVKQQKVIQDSAKSREPAPHAMAPARGYVWDDHGDLKIGNVAGKGQLAPMQVFGFDEKHKKAGEVGGLVLTLHDTPVPLVIYSMNSLANGRMCGRYSDLILDFSATNGLEKAFPIGIVDSTDGGKELSIITLNVASLTELFISPDYVVFPGQQREMQQYGPFALVDFVAPGKIGKGGIGASTLILTRNGVEITRRKLRGGGDFTITLKRVQTSNDVLEWQIENAAGRVTQKGSLGFPVRGATPDIVRYDVALDSTPR